MASRHRGMAFRLVQLYFNQVYNPIYDLTTGRLNRYRVLQQLCVGRLGFKDNDTTLCVGVGTGNEVTHILRRNSTIDIVGIDYSPTALRRARRKGLALGRRIETSVMDARHLDFPSASFDQVLCIHVMDFVTEKDLVTSELLRVLKNGGQFAITYPSRSEGVALALDLLKDGIRDKASSGKSRLRAFAESLAELLAGILYVPLLLRQRRPCSRKELETLFSELTTGPYRIEEHAAYRDFIISGQKANEEVKANAG